MIHTIRSEFIKLRTIAAHRVLVVVAVAFPLVIVTLVAAFAEMQFGGIRSDEVSDLIVGLTVVSAMLLGALCAISLTGEYGHNTIRPTYAATPNRFQVIGSKVVVNSEVVLVSASASVFGSWLVASVVLSARDNPIGLGDSDVIATLVSGIALAWIVSLFALGLSLVIRNTPATVTILLLWPLLIEGLISLAFSLLGSDGASKWLPYQAAIGAVTGDGDPNRLGRPMGLVYFAVVSLALVVLGAALDNRRDA